MSEKINNLLNLKGDKKAKHGVVNFQTKGIAGYNSNDSPLGIELNVQYGADAVKKEAIEYIEQQIKTNNPNNFVQCIWYCIIGNRFEQDEIDLLNSLRSAYDNNRILIIIMYTQGIDNNAINGLKKYIEDKNIGALFIKILAERKELANNQYLEVKAMKREMRSVMTNNIEFNIKNKLIKENASISKYIYEQIVLKSISTYKTI